MLLMLRIITDTLHDENAAMYVTYFGTNIANYCASYTNICNRNAHIIRCLDEMSPKHYSNGIRNELPEAMTMDSKKVPSLNKHPPVLFLYDEHKHHWTICLIY